MDNDPKRKATFFVLLLLVLQYILPARILADHYGLAQGKNVLIVASYHEEYKWTMDIIRTLDRELSGADLTVFYMDTKRNFDDAEAKGKEAFALYQKLKPDAVISIDDAAQSHFVVPYLKDKVTIPVFFCGVNDDASKYGFPATNVTGVLEKKHYIESISFAQMIEPKVRKLGILYRPSPSNTINLAQIEKEKEKYTADVVVTIAVQSLAEVQKALVDHSSTVDAWMLLNLSGVTDANNKMVEGHDAIEFIANSTDLVTIGASDWEVRAGALCGVIKSGQEQGELVSQLIFAHWKGKDIKDLPLEQNKNGQRFINLSTLKRLKIKLRPEMVIGTKIVSEK